MHSELYDDWVKIMIWYFILDILIQFTSTSLTFKAIVKLENALKFGQLPADLKIPCNEVKVDPAKNKLMKE